MKQAKLGQHFLVNRNLAEKIVRAFLPVAGVILEIGPGKGILTDLLIKYRDKNRLAAVELDETLFSQLEDKYRDREEVEILNRDILKTDLQGIFPGGAETVNVIGNVPYYISSEIIDWVIAYNKKISKGMFMMQREFVDRFLPGKKSKAIDARSILFNGLFHMEKRFDVRPGSFSPRPKVKSSVFSFKRRVDVEIDTANFYLFLRGCFRNRRKTLANNLAAILDMEKVEKIFTNLRFHPKIRAEQLTLEDFLEIYHF